MASTPLICVVDDQADYRFLLQQIFHLYFPTYPVRFFDGGQGLLNALPELSRKPSLILLDRHMPQFDGHQTLLTLKTHPDYKRIPVVMMSADASTIEINGCYDTGVNSFLMKKMDFQRLKETVESVCRYWLETNQEPVEV